MTLLAASHGFRSVHLPGTQPKQIIVLAPHLGPAKERSPEHSVPELRRSSDPVFLDEYGACVGTCSDLHATNLSTATVGDNLTGSQVVHTIDSVQATRAQKGLPSGSDHGSCAEQHRRGEGRQRVRHLSTEFQFHCVSDAA